jgi:hypothetical protein
MEYNAQDYSHIPGWGIDADPEDHPNYPMKKYTGDDHNRSNYQRPVQQESQIEKLHSNERPNLSAVYGTPNPPSGLSGMIRRYAFKHSENRYRHWLPLILADRVNVIEGIVEDLGKGIIPNIFAEKGWGAEWKYNRAGLIKKVAVLTAIAAGIILYTNKKKIMRSIRS